MSASEPDKKELIDQLKIDREQAADTGRPIKWFLVVAVIGGAAIVAWAVGVPFVVGEPELAVKTVLARAADPIDRGTSVLKATGYVVARRQATVSSKTTGKVVEVFIEEGMVVEQGQLLAVLDDSIPRARFELAQSRGEVARAMLKELDVGIRRARLDLERTRNLAERQLASKADLDRDELALEGLLAQRERTEWDVVVAERSLAVQGKELEDMQIRAPFAGVVIAKAAQPGEMISPISAGGGFTRTGICTIVDMDSLEVEVDVNESYINRVHPKQPALVNLKAYPDLDIPAEVIAIIPAADRNKATVRVRIGFLERDPRILPDMGVDVSFLGGEESHGADEPAGSPDPSQGSILVPRKSVAEEDGERYVWVVRGNTVTKRMVRGRSEAGSFRIIEGLAQGDRIVASLDDLAADLTDGAKVRVAN